MGEIMFVVIVISAETLHMLFKMLLGHPKQRSKITTVFMVLSFIEALLSILIAAVLYGTILLQDLQQIKSAWIIAIIFTAISFLFGLGMQIISSRKEEQQ